MLGAGTVVAGYRIESLLGEGGMATVYEAHQVALNRVVALKVLTRRLGDDPDFRERFRRECHIQAGLDHPNIVPVYQAGEGEYGLWLTMRLVRGPTLHQLLHAGRLSPERALGILGPVAEALDAAHEAGLIHRDITPQNILIDKRDHPYLSDFGVTKGKGDRSLTRTGQFIGTLDYVAPEQVRGERSDVATDTYALAAILFECLTGRVPFVRESDAAVLYAHAHEPPPVPSAVDASVSPAFDPVLRKGLAKQPGDRYQSPTELIAAARGALNADSESAAPAVSPVPARSEDAAAGRSWPRRATILGGLLLLLLLLLVIAVVAGALTSPDSSAEARRVASGDLSVAAPPGWAETTDGSGVPGLPLTGSVVLAPEAGGGETASFGISAAQGRTMLPARLRRSAVGAAAGKPVSLGALQALRYRGLRMPGAEGRLTVFVVPTSVGVATLACRPDRGGTEFSRLCGRLAASLKLKQGRPYALGPSPRLEVELRRRLTNLNESRDSLRRRLARVRGAAEQGEAAAGLAAAFRRASHALAGLKVTPQSAAALTALIASLRSTRNAYKDLAAAARGEDPVAFESAGRVVNEREAAVDQRLRGLHSLGYRVAAAG